MSSYLAADLNDTICALATPGGVGAIGVIRLSGKDAIAIVNEVFKGHDLNKAASHTVHFGKIVDPSSGSTVDEVLAAVFVSPRSYTGENTVELSCHGSPYIQQQLLELLVRQGARMAKPGEFTLRAFLNRKLDLSQAEAVADLIASDNAETHRTAMSQMRGGFSQQISGLREKLLNFTSLIELELDFSEEDVEFAHRDELKATVQKIHTLVSALIDSFRYGNAIKNGIPTVIAGKPNAGKSTLLNALLNEDRAIVSEIAGTTRDTIEEAFVIDGIPFRLIDTAGIRSKASDTIEEIGIGRTYEKIQRASIVMYLFDANTTKAEELEEELKVFEDIEAIVIPVANKVDLLGDEQLQRLQRLDKVHGERREEESWDQANLLAPRIIPVSSKLNLGIDRLRSRLIQVVQKDKVKNDIVITNLRHYQALIHTRQALDDLLAGLHNKQTTELLAADIRKAIFYLGEITGEITTDDLLANIFSKFCIGK